MNSHHVL